MNKNIRYIKKAAWMAIPALLLASCSDWTETESLKLNEPSIETQNPELYEQYLGNLRAYKASAHKVVIASFDNVAELPTSRGQHLTDMPDSLDYICLNNIKAVNEVNAAEMEEVRRFGTKVLGLVDFDAIDSAWKAILEEEKNNASGSEAPSGEGTAEEGEATDDAARFIEYCKKEVSAIIEACDAKNVDGIEINYTGFDLNSLVAAEDIAAETARQGAFFDAINSWKAAHADKLLFFKGAPQNVISKAILNDCKYIIVNAHSAKNLYEMSYFVLMASTKDVPADRFVMGVTTPYLTNSGTYNGELGDGSSAIIAAAQWALTASTDYTKAGVSIDAVEQDYYSNVNNVYPNVKEAIAILNPTVK